MQTNVIKAYSDFLSKFEDLFLPSLKVDFILFLLGIKPCLRTRIKNYESYKNHISSWCQYFDLFHVVEFNDFFYMSKNINFLKEVKELDHSITPHENRFGQLMGYPLCCRKKIASIGEVNIDAYEASLKKLNFIGKFSLINPSLYVKGKAFISHVPCSSTCVKSLKQAQKLADFVISNREEYILSQWLEELDKIGYPTSYQIKNQD